MRIDIHLYYLDRLVSRSVQAFCTADIAAGKSLDLACDELYRIPPEITWLLKSLGFRRVDSHGAKPGAFSRRDALTKDDFEMLMIAED